MKPEVQLSLLNKSVEDPDTDRKALTVLNKKRRRDKRLTKSGTPSAWLPCASSDRYLVVRAAPDWDTEKVDDLKLIPVADYVSDRAVLCLVAENRNLDKAFKVMEAWGFHYESMLTAWHEEETRETPYHYGGASHFIICTRDTMRVPRFDGLTPRRYCEELADSSEETRVDFFAGLIDDMFRNALTECRLLDACATEAVDGWESLKARYGRKIEAKT
jgi:hypothetical protein